MENKKTVFDCKSITEFITFIGCMFTGITVKAATVIFNFIKIPVLFAAGGIAHIVKLIVNFIKSSFREQVGDKNYFSGKLIKSLRLCFIMLKKSPSSVPPLLAYFYRRGKKRYRSVAGYTLLILIPLFSGVLLGLTLRYYSVHPVALRIECNDSVVGYAASEEDFLKAKAMTAERLTAGADSNSTEGVLPEIKYTLAFTSVNKYTNVQELCDRLTRLSGIKTVNACGVYIDGEFLCAVKNESDAKSVFDGIIEGYSNKEPDAIVDFVQKTEYISGVYPDSDSVIRTSAYLEKAVKNLLKDGEGLTIKIMKTETEEVEVPCDTVEIQSDMLYIGSSRTLVNGKSGTDKITNLVVYINGEKESVSEVSRLRVIDPVDKRVQVGTKPLDANYNYSSHLGGMLVWPVINADHINSPYGYRWGKLHSAIDIGSSVGTSLGKLIVAAAGGRVIISGVHSSYGYYIKIDHGNGFQTLYAHCLPGSLMVNAGDEVAAGQPIARVGQSGYATGPHLHFEVIINGNKVNPAPYLGL